MLWGVLGLLGRCLGAILGPGGPKVSAGTEKERNSELFPPAPGPDFETLSAENAKKQIRE